MDARPALSCGLKLGLLSVMDQTSITGNGVA
ncbi:hypothetical protein SacmaDRAFT_0830 [Saccharomonospora marina XMU15]|uniref:Uncharacterized protein n=1 Tax=Saccharomonospora marina XMU15 TaxID=882083 RepID=H5X895_9PSEU|nr:hypothetical protein SacmaDRAFT_0830 [Saccharomonospora marina XMU15]